MSFADELREQTAEAQRVYDEQLKSEQAAKDAAIAARNAQLRSEANAIIATVELVCKKAAADRKKEAEIMDLNMYGNDQDIFNASSNQATRAHLGLRAGLVYDYIESLGLKAELRYEHDGVGMESWYVLYATW